MSYPSHSDRPIPSPPAIAGAGVTVDSEPVLKSSIIHVGQFVWRARRGVIKRPLPSPLSISIGDRLTARDIGKNIA